MKPLQVLLIIVSVTVGCSEQSDDNVGPTTLEKSERHYRLIRDDLYTDDLGNIYHRTIDVSAADNPDNPEYGKAYSYLDYVRLDTLINGEGTYICIDLKDIVDTASFHRVEPKETNLDYEIYEDNYTRYFLKFVADGGTLDATRK